MISVNDPWVSNRLTLYADPEVEEGPYYHMRLDNLDSQAGLPSTAADDLTEDEDEWADDGGAESEERKHKQPYPSPPRDVDLGGVWNLRNVKSDRQVEESETEPESNGEQEQDLSGEDNSAISEGSVSTPKEALSIWFLRTCAIATRVGLR